MDMYSEERNVQMIVYMMKEYNIRNVIVCPGAGNITLVMTLQNDSFFKIKSVIDERSATYMACGLAQELGEPVAVSVTGNVAMRNTIPGMTEAYYRKLPILLITSTSGFDNVGNYWPQILDESSQFRDAQKITVHVPMIESTRTEWLAGVNINRAFSQLLRDGGGPVHIHHHSQAKREYIDGNLPEMQVVRTFTRKDSLPELVADSVVVCVGNHKKWTAELIEAVEFFCERYNAMVLCDNTSNYQGRYRICPALLWNQQNVDSELKKFDVVIHIGEPSGSHMIPKAKQVWRVDCDGEIRDTFMKLRYVFEMEEIDFFDIYNRKAEKKSINTELYQKWNDLVCALKTKIPELPFSNAYIASKSSKMLPENSSVYFAILNTLRCWNLFGILPKISGYSNTGGFGIDGGLSTLIGMSFANPDKIYFGIFGDLGFFFDMNALGNRHLGRNVRILLINNGMGGEFKMYRHIAEELGDSVDTYVAAAGHFNSKSLVKHYAKDLGMEYMSASSKEEFLEKYESFFSQELKEKAVVFECFTDSIDEREALRILYNIL